MESFEQELIVSQQDIDDRNHVNNVRYVEWVQDVAKADWTLKASEKTQQNFYWVMISHHIQSTSFFSAGPTSLLLPRRVSSRRQSSARRLRPPSTVEVAFMLTTVHIITATV